MTKKDIDFGLKEIEIDEYKLKKNNSGKLISIILLIVVTISYYQYSSNKSDEIACQEPSLAITLWLLAPPDSQITVVPGSTLSIFGENSSSTTFTIWGC